MEKHFLKRLTKLVGAGLFGLALTGCASLKAPPDAARAPVSTLPPSEGSAQAIATASVASAAATTAAAVSVTVPASAPRQETEVRLKTDPVVGLQPQVDLWERIRRGFGMPDLDNALVRSRERWYASRPDYLLRMTERSRPYLFHIVQEIERRGMPTELALLPFIESAFNPQAVSSAKAAGMWQFMPATGKYFDLKQNLFRDDRRDVLESTRAALDYLQKLYDMFDDWHLALAAYNWGEGSVGRALARNKAQGLPLSYSHLRMPNETRDYVPKLQAVKNIVAQPQLFGAVLPDIHNHPYFRSVPIERDIDVALAARLAEVSLEDFKALNPSMSRPVILAAGTPQILLPWDNADVFMRNLKSHEGLRLSTWTAWVAPRTMKVEEAARAVGMEHEPLRTANGIPRGMLVKAGSTLVVHRRGSLDADVSEHLADHAQLALAPEIVLRRIRITARQGDTLSSLAARHGVSAANLASWNRLGPNSSLRKGQVLEVLLPSQARKANAPRKPAVARPAARKAAPPRKTR
ncbi:MAG: transglycosylase SLT domain-containing protein [Limnohabitans sp.]